MTPSKRTADASLIELRRSVEDQQQAPVLGASNSGEPIQSTTVGSQDCPRAASSAAASSDARPSTDAESQNQELSSQVSSEAASASAVETLDGVPTVATEAVGGITISDEIERLLRSKVVKNLKGNTADNAFKRTNLYSGRGEPPIGVHPLFGKEKARYRNAMKMVAMSITVDQWREIHTCELTDEAMRRFCAEVERQTMDRAFDLEATYGIRRNNPRKKTKYSSTLHSMGTRWTALEKTMKGKGYRLSDEDIANVVARYTGEQASQSTMSSFYGGVARLDTSA